MLLFLAACHLFDNPEIATCEKFGCDTAGGDDTGDGLDADGDGLTADLDCDDDDPDVGEPVTVYVDADGDGYGDPDTETETCEPASDEVSEAGDCDDSSADAAPGLEEVCGDGLDNDCNGTANGCEPNGSLSVSTAADVHIDGVEKSYDQTGYSVAILGDVDADGTNELAIGTPQNDTFGGVVSVCDVDTPSGSLPGDCEVQLYGSVASSGVGYQVKNGGDINGDGVDDALVAATFADPNGVSNAGWVGVFWGPLDGEVDETKGAGLYTTSESSAYLGQALGAGDLDGDGDVELVMGGRNVGSYGGVYVMDEWPSPGSVIDVDDYTGAVTSETSGSFANEIGHPGDVDGDGADDLIVTDYQYGSGGALFVFLGPLTSRLGEGEADLQLDGVSSGNVDYVGYTGAQVVPDQDGDGYAEVLVGALYGEGDETYAGRAYLVDGPQTSGSLPDVAQAIFLGESGQAYAGWSTGSADVNGDGAMDVVVGAPREDINANFQDARRVYVSYGPNTGTMRLAEADFTLTGANAYDQLGEEIATGDIDGDGHGDLLLGTYQASDGDGDAFLVKGYSY